METTAANLSPPLNIRFVIVRPPESQTIQQLITYVFLDIVDLTLIIRHAGLLNSTPDIGA